MSGTNGVAVAPDFSHFASTKIDGRRIWLELPEDPYGKDCAIEGVTANTSYNSSYVADKLVISGGRSAIGDEKKPEALDRWRFEDRELFARHVLTGWKNVRDKQGEQVEFSTEAAIAFLASMPNEILDLVRFHFNKIANFRKPIAIAEIAGNSGAGSSSN
jgi:hypothetical protein